jgi:hypothetical protein
VTEARSGSSITRAIAPQEIFGVAFEKFFGVMFVTTRAPKCRAASGDGASRVGLRGHVRRPAMLVGERDVARLHEPGSLSRLYVASTSCEHAASTAKYSRAPSPLYFKTLIFMDYCRFCDGVSGSAELLHFNGASEGPAGCPRRRGGGCGDPIRACSGRSAKRP